MVLILPTPISSFMAVRDYSVKQWRNFFRGVAVAQACIGFTQIVLGDRDGLVVCFISIFSWIVVDFSLCWVLFVGVALCSHGVTILVASIINAADPRSSLTVAPYLRYLKILLGLVNTTAGVTACYVYKKTAPSDRSMFMQVMPLIHNETTSCRPDTSGQRADFVGAGGEMITPFSGTSYKIGIQGRESIWTPALKYYGLNGHEGSTAATAKTLPTNNPRTDTDHDSPDGGSCADVSHHYSRL